MISEKQLQTKKYKKEYKNAVKEIRLDNKFISNIQFKENMEKYVVKLFLFKFFNEFIL